MQPFTGATKSTNGNAAGNAEECARQVLNALPPVMWFVRRHMRAHRKGLSIPQFRALAKVSVDPKASLSDVAEHLGGSLSTTSRLVTVLVENGLLSRTGCREDRRQLSLGITARGKAVLDAAREQTQERMQEELSQLSAEERATVESAMQSLTRIFGSFEWSGPMPEESSRAAAEGPGARAKVRSR